MQLGIYSTIIYHTVILLPNLIAVLFIETTRLIPLVTAALANIIPNI